MTERRKITEEKLKEWLEMRAEEPNERKYGKSRLKIDEECAALGYWVIADAVPPGGSYREVKVVCKQCMTYRAEVPLHKLRPCSCHSGETGESAAGRPIRTDYSEWGKKVLKVIPGNRRRVQCVHCGHIWDQARSSLTRTPCPRCSSGGDGKLWCWATHDGFGWGSARPLNVERAVAAFTGNARRVAIEACRNPRTVCACDPVEALQFWAIMHGKEFISC